ncbi:MAG: flippase-like domain-containing protein [Marinicaulis sp.]|nr:flippase-like domain-containing protein [Marinicaulis sp.]
MFNDIQWDKFVIVIFVLAPLMTAANILTIKETACLSGVEISYLSAFRVLVMSSAANNLPLPGGPVVRIAVFCEAGATVKSASLANLAGGILWMGATFTIAGAFALSINSLFGIGLFTVGVGLCVFGARLCASLPGRIVNGLRLFLISCSAAVLYCVALYHAMAALGAPTGLPEAFVISVAGVVGAALSPTPSGFGIRESLSAGLASTVGAAPAVAFAATALVYLTMLGLLALSAVIFSASPLKHHFSQKTNSTQMNDLL